MVRSIRLISVAYWVVLVLVVGQEVAAYAGLPGIDWRWATADLLVWIAVGVVGFDALTT